MHQQMANTYSVLYSQSISCFCHITTFLHRIIEIIRVSDMKWHFENDFECATKKGFWMLNNKSHMILQFIKSYELSNHWTVSVVFAIVLSTHSYILFVYIEKSEISHGIDQLELLVQSVNSTFEMIQSVMTHKNVRIHYFLTTDETSSHLSQNPELWTFKFAFLWFVSAYYGPSFTAAT